ncbi:translocator protein-like [Plodia interpunctella]|uniref:translocator protein-like n=1 Tax=Plodia interpunctella TaxID=58824 RepID=UPI00236751C9|nr:translocator protein-like [Plodia interpunctella]
MIPAIVGWITYAISCVMLRRPKAEIWVEKLKIPRFYPPNWLVLTIWTMLCFGIGYASYMVYIACGGFTSEAGLPLSLYGSQLLVLWTWSLGFFYFVILDITAVACTSTFFHVDIYTMYAMVPYLAFLGFMSLMFYRAWKLNHVIENEVKEQPVNTSPYITHKYVEYGLPVSQSKF